MQRINCNANKHEAKSIMRCNAILSPNGRCTKQRKGKAQVGHGQWTQIARRVADFQIGHCLQFQIYQHKRMQSWIMTEALYMRARHRRTVGTSLTRYPKWPCLGRWANIEPVHFCKQQRQTFPKLTCTHGLGFLSLCFFDDCKLLNWKRFSFAVNIG